MALTLRTLGGLETDEIARAFVVKPATMAQHLVRAETKVRAAGVPYRVPNRDELPGLALLDDLAERPALARYALLPATPCCPLRPAARHARRPAAAAGSTGRGARGVCPGDRAGDV